MLIKAINGALKSINHNVEVTGDAQKALNQLLRIRSIHKIVREAMINEERICEENNQYVIDWGDGDVFAPDANVVFNVILDIKSMLKNTLVKEDQD